MANESLIKVGGAIPNLQHRFFVTASFSPASAKTNHTIGSPTDWIMALSAVATATGYGSEKADLGVTRARRYECLGCVDYTGETPTQGGTIRYYWAPSTSDTDGQGNVGGTDGATGAVPSNGLGSITLADFLANCQYIGQLTVHDGASVQNGWVGVFEPSSRYGQLIVVNDGGDAFEADDVEMHQVLNPIVDELQ